MERWGVFVNSLSLFIPVEPAEVAKTTILGTEILYCHKLIVVVLVIAKGTVFYFHQQG